MNLRENLNKHSRGTTAGAAVIIALALGVAIWQIWPHRHRDSYKEIYFTADDGKTYFADDRMLVPPFDKNGGQAVRAYVVRCGSGKPFVFAMTRFSEKGKKELEKLASKGQLNNDAFDAYFMETEMKRPGDPKWKPWSNSSDGSEALHCPNKDDQPMPVYP